MCFLLRLTGPPGQPRGGPPLFPQHTGKIKSLSDGQLNQELQAAGSKLVTLIRSPTVKLQGNR